MTLPRRIAIAFMLLLIMVFFQGGLEISRAASFTAGTEAELVSAITTANGNGAADTITLTAAITLTAPLPQISSEITIEGAGYSLDGNNDAAVGSVVFLTSAGNLTLNNITVTGGMGTAYGVCPLTCGGGIYNNQGTLTVTNSTITGNSSANANGGGIFSHAGTVTVSSSTISGNTARDGGAIYGTNLTNVTVTQSALEDNTTTAGGGAWYGTGGSAITVTESTVSGNTTLGNGGGLYNGGTLTITNSTVSGNNVTRSTGTGGAVYNGGTATITNSTIVSNTAGIGSGIHAPGLTNLSNSIVAGNLNGSNCQIETFSTFNTTGTNLANDTSCTGFTESASINMGPLQFNGGLTKTRALLAGSSAIDAAGACGLGTDQRGATRPSNACDVGAFELQTMPLTNTNLVQDGVFDSGLAYWSTWGDIDRSASGGVLSFNRKSPGWKIATVFQTVNYGLPVGADMEIRATIGNSSNVPKGVEVLFRDTGWKQFMSCSFTIPANTPLTGVVLQDTTNIAWTGAVIALRAYDPDGIGSIRVDNVDVRYKPGLNLTGMNCTGHEIQANSEMVNNGTFSSGLRYWTLWGDFSFTVNAGVMEFYRLSGAAKNAVLFADAAYHMQAGQELELSLQVGNSSGVTKNIQVFVRDVNWSQNFQCSFAIPANQPLTAVSVKGTTSSQWGRPMVIVRALDADGLPAVRVDNVSLQYKPGLTTTPACDAGTLAVEGFALAQPVSEPALTDPLASDPPPPAATDPAPAATDPPTLESSDAPAGDPVPGAVPTDPPAPPAAGSAYTAADLEAALGCVTHAGAAQSLASHLDDLPQFLELLEIHTANGNIDTLCSDAIRAIAEVLR